MATAKVITIHTNERKKKASIGKIPGTAFVIMCLGEIQTRVQMD
jgi:hypothetical protein